MPENNSGNFCRGLLAALCALLWVNSAQADDWPQWQGPDRDGIYRELPVPDRLSGKTLPVVWRAAVGGGYAGPAVAGGRVFVSDYVGDTPSLRPQNPFQRVTQPGHERITCFDSKSGTLLWQHSEPVAYGMSYSAGPRATPTIDDHRLYSLGAEGQLRCLAADSGQQIWSVQLADKQHATPMWGFACNPLVDGNRLIVISGGADPAGGRGAVTAFDKLTGKVLWTALSSAEPGYSSPLIIQAGGVRQLVVWDPLSINGLNPEDGTVYWSVPFGPANQNMSVITPRFTHDPVLGDLLFVASQYEGSCLLKLDSQRPAASVLWKRRGKNDRHTDGLHIVAWPPVIRDGYIYGVDCYGPLRCLRLSDGERMWQTSDATTYDAGDQKWASAFLIPLGEQGDRYLIANEHGDLLLARMNARSFERLWLAHVIDPANTDPGRPVVWSHPALADHCIFWRSDKQIVCASLADDGQK